MQYYKNQPSARVTKRNQVKLAANISFICEVLKSVDCKHLVKSNTEHPLTEKEFIRALEIKRTLRNRYSSGRLDSESTKALEKAGFIFDITTQNFLERLESIVKTAQGKPDLQLLSRVPKDQKLRIDRNWLLKNLQPTHFRKLPESHRNALKKAKELLIR